jgi:hypothetical protein
MAASLKTLADRERRCLMSSKVDLAVEIFFSLFAVAIISFVSFVTYQVGYFHGVQSIVPPQNIESKK